jgi:hypothetical protein
MPRSQEVAKSETAKPVSAFMLMRETCDRATRVQVMLEQQGEKPTPEAIWAVMAGEETPMPHYFNIALETDSYHTLLDIRRRTAVIPALEHLGIIRELSAKGAYMAMVSALEDLATNPDKIPIGEKRQLAKTFMEMNMRLRGEGNNDNAILTIAMEEEDQMEQVLARVPAEYRDDLRPKWKEERMKQLDDRKRVHIVKDIKAVTHGRR